MSQRYAFEPAPPTVLGFALRPGDLIFSGTPEGVGPVQRGELMVAGVSPLPDLRVRVH